MGRGIGMLLRFRAEDAAEEAANAAKEAGLELMIEAPNCMAPSMIMAIEQFLQKNHKK